MAFGLPDRTRLAAIPRELALEASSMDEQKFVARNGSCVERI